MIDIYFFRLYNFDVDLHIAWRTTKQSTYKDANALDCYVVPTYK